MTFPRPNPLSRSGSRSGFTLVEILVVIAIIALLAGVALPAITGAIKKARESAALQAGHGLAVAMFQYSSDNGGVFPGKIGAVTVTTSTDAFNKLLCPTYVPNTDTLWIAGGPGAKYTGSTTTYNLMGGYPLTAASNVTWDLWTRTDGTGQIAVDPDTSPVISSSGCSAPAYGASNTTAPITVKIVAADTNPFGTDGIAVGHKDMSSSFQSSTAAGGTAAGGFNVTSVSYTPADMVLKKLNP